MPAHAVRDVLAYAIKVKIDPDKGGKEKNLVNKIGVTGYPTLIFIGEPGGRQINLKSGTAKGGEPKPQVLADDFRDNLRYFWRKSAIEASKNKQFAKTIELADRMLAFDPEDPKGDMFHIRGLAFLHKNDLPQAFRDFQLACRAGHQGDCAELRLRGF